MGHGCLCFESVCIHADFMYRRIIQKRANHKFYSQQVFYRQCRIDTAISERKKGSQSTSIQTSSNASSIPPHLKKKKKNSSSQHLLEPVQMLQAFFFTSADLIMSMNSGWRKPQKGNQLSVKGGAPKERAGVQSNTNGIELQYITFREAPPTKNPSTSG